MAARRKKVESSILERLALRIYTYICNVMFLISDEGKTWKLPGRIGKLEFNESGPSVSLSPSPESAYYLSRQSTQLNLPVSWP